MRKDYDNKDFIESLDDMPDMKHLPRIKNMPENGNRKSRKHRLGSKGRQAKDKILAELIDQDDSIKEVEFTYTGSRHEREWIVNSLGNLYEAQWFDDVLRQIKGGKEASVYQCLGNATTGANYIAAKIYRPRRFRNLKNDHLYREGRERLDADGHMILDGGMQHAMNKRTEYGLQLLHTSWIEHEYQSMRILHAAGADVPVPYARGDNAILMAYIGGPDMAAPTLNTIDLAQEEAQVLFLRVLKNIDLMLSVDRVHGDLSAYNVLYWEGEMTIIDFPQAISPHTNRNAYMVFERDVARVCEYFALQGVRSDARRIAADLWTAHHHRMSPSDVNLALLDPEDQDDLAYWEKYLKEL